VCGDRLKGRLGGGGVVMEVEVLSVKFVVFVGGCGGRGGMSGRCGRFGGRIERRSLLAAVVVAVVVVVVSFGNCGGWCLGRFKWLKWFCSTGRASHPTSHKHFKCCTDLVIVLVYISS
jgi:hypothetical protein